MRNFFVAAAVGTALFLGLAGGASAASIWAPIASGTSNEITGIEYQSDSRFWFVTSAGEIFTRQADGTFARKFGPSAVRLTDIRFQPGGAIGIAVGNNGQVLRSTDSGATWTNVNPGGTPIPVSQGDTTFANCQSSDPLGNVFSVRFAGSGRVWITGQGAQLATSQPATVANVGAAGTWVDANRDTHGTGDPSDDTCRLGASYGDGTGDVFFAPTNPDVGYFCTTFFGEVFLTTNNLTSSGAKQTADCGNGTAKDRRIAGDSSSPSRMWAVSPGGEGTSYMHHTEDGWASAESFQIANDTAHAVGTPYDVAAAGTTVVAVGDGGLILNSADGRSFFHVPADGSIATTGWRSVGLASPTQAAIGGTGGTLAVSTQANSTPDIVAPAGTISGPTTVTAGTPATYTANVADNAGGSGINPGSFVWTATGLPTATGNPVTVTFPSSGYYSLKVAFTDNAGNPASATIGVSVTAPAPPPFPAGTFTPGYTKTSTIPGGTITLSGPRTCVPVGKTFTATLSFKRSRKKGAKKVKITRVDFYIDKKRVKIDRKAPFKQRLSARSYVAGSLHTLKGRAYIKVRKGKKVPKKSVSAKFRVCSV